jgi:hypothetical protein
LPIDQLPPRGPGFGLPGIGFPVAPVTPQPVGPVITPGQGSGNFFDSQENYEDLGLEEKANIAQNFGGRYLDVLSGQVKTMPADDLEYFSQFNRQPGRGLVGGIQPSIRSLI